MYTIKKPFDIYIFWQKILINSLCFDARIQHLNMVGQNSQILTFCTEKPDEKKISAQSRLPSSIRSKSIKRFV